MKRGFGRGGKSGKKTVSSGRRASTVSGTLLKMGERGKNRGSSYRGTSTRKEIKREGRET